MTTSHDAKRALLWMTVLAIILFWVPVLGPFLAGFVGGRAVGGPGPAAVVALLPAVLAGGLFGLLALALPRVGPFLATLVGTAIAIWLLIQGGLVILGALAGGWSVSGGRSRGVPAVR